MTDTLVLKNTKFTKGLVMPKKGTYLELDQDEMEYVDGGVTAQVICGAIGFAGAVLSYVASIVGLAAELGIIKLNFFARIIVWGIAAFGSLCQIVGKVSILSNLGDAAVKIVAKECLSFLGLVGLSTTQFAACVYNISRISR